MKFEIKNLLKDPRTLLFAMIILWIPAFVCSAALGYVPTWSIILMCIGSLGLLVFIKNYILYYGGLIVKGVKWIINKIRGK
jgi:hypothetical protein